MKKTCILFIVVLVASCKKEAAKPVGAPIRPVSASSSKFINKVYDYQPAPGQFINESIGDQHAPERILGSAEGLVSLGAYGGYLVFGFDHSILNRSGMDLAIYGNPISAPTEWSEPGIVMVSEDLNGNALPDDAWYELSGSAASSAVKNYRITYYNPKADSAVRWADSRGDTGSVAVNGFHHHNYFPLFTGNQDSLSFMGTLLANTMAMNGSGTIYINTPFDFGYSDSWSVGDDYEAHHYNSFDIDRAVDSSGAAKSLKAIDFVKVYTGQNNPGNGMLGEISTEVGGAADLNMP